MYWTIKTSSSILTGCPEAPTNRFESWAARNLVRFQIVAANLDPEVLQWPGGSLIASLLWLCMMARSLWWVGTVARLHLPGAQAGSPRIARQSGWQARQSVGQLLSDRLRFTRHAIYVLPATVTTSPRLIGHQIPKPLQSNRERLIHPIDPGLPPPWRFVYGPHSSAHWVESTATRVGRARNACHAWPSFDQPLTPCDPPPVALPPST
jgi:hypothetical protein